MISKLAYSTSTASAARKAYREARAAEMRAAQRAELAARLQVELDEVGPGARFGTKICLAEGGKWRPVLDAPDLARILTNGQDEVEYWPLTAEEVARRWA